MLRGLLSLGLVFATASSGLAVGQAAGSENGAPSQQLVRIDSSGQLQVYYLVSVCIPETQTRTVTQFVDVQEEFTEEVDGQVVKKTRTVKKPVTKEVAYTVTKMVQETKVRKANLDRLQAFETDGRTIPPKKLKERFTEDTLVVVSANSKMIPDYYAGLFKPGTIILAFEPETFVQPMPPIAPPAEGIEAPPATAGHEPRDAGAPAGRADGGSRGRCRRVARPGIRARPGISEGGRAGVRLRQPRRR